MIRSFFFSGTADHRALHSFPTRRSSDLPEQTVERRERVRWAPRDPQVNGEDAADAGADLDRKSTRLNSSHGSISYAVFCLKKKSLEVERDEVHEQEPI